MRRISFLLLIPLLAFLFFSTITYCEEQPFKEPKRIRCTCYIVRGTTASGQETRTGILAGKRSWMGKTAILYRINEDESIGEIIGYYEVLDTGAGIDTDGDGKGDTIINGKSIDIWMPSMDDAKAWIKEYGDYVYLQLVDAEG